ncbi:MULTISPECIES: tRNA lysidine(34) synthetase TilS [unclassified Campylobacter]|uniref:tRNA lysidine(34) synthetase TilS n=1 Tax=unclassified Campylobacter TaxID=2593542 RepID=UPI0022E9C3E0|nr:MULTISPECIES: tRNA lysidine(34) synthetase TilS [unclassified Campylobacter]MDA3043496.1 tRNA lysidine(34) synthetase TilS [Campylobacter sp. JMF_09 ED2]MDA3045250.1 tRNA lysidine(34) synthetase TilS [Campylobacter sp. JMF_07 ED4]MDA3064150.1 tRNA lysidine(34) synthetase TilS [Campylobacter sp. JMF_11 EL3]MDA3071978.1 tRNA lysidine(34) synthetase TilS [Campylobacter sp. VBCF_03 NA9]MDA3075338.1 tRNA lysidine(34) synthetase TilS [Campylobacter sp. JMF_05 ED3]
MKTLNIDIEILDFLRGRKNLLAFSHGSDSTALFYTLLNLGVKFDCAFVNYKTRKQSNEEEASAKKLCEKFGVNLFIKTASLDLQNSSNFENQARKIRYEFFDEIAVKFGFNTLITAHQLNDKFEWFLMQLGRGAGLANLLGFEKIENRTNFTLVRPFYDISKTQILEFLSENKIKFFNDISNENTKFARNAVRAEFSDKFVEKYALNLAKSFEFLSLDKANLMGEFIYQKDKFFVLENSQKSLNLIDKACKILGVVLSQNQRKEIQKTDCVISGKICVCKNEKFYFVAPFEKTKMDKKFKEKCRILKIPPLIRPYIFARSEILAECEGLISGLNHSDFVDKIGEI